MTKRLIAIILALVICVMISGCDIRKDNDDMVSPPELTGEMAPIAQALYESIATEYDLQYPASGDRRSAIVLEDINGDGVFEAFAFYSTSEDELTTMHINTICQIDGEWTSVVDQTIVAIGVELVDFCDLNSDGTLEILIGWEVNGSNEKQLSVFTFKDNMLTQVISQAYTDFLCCDLDDDGTNEIFVHLLNTVEKTNKAIIYTYSENGVAQTAGCAMDPNVKSSEKPVLATLSNGQKAIYIDEIKGVGAVTEVLYMLRGELVNPLLDRVNSFENLSTLRAAALETKDINGDNVLEIPVASDLPNAANTDEKLFYTNWCSFNGEKLTVKQITVVNTVDGYYVNVPNNMVGNIAVLKDIENHERTFYNYDTKQTLLGDMLFTISVVGISDWDKADYDRGNATELARNKSNVFVITLADAASARGITEEMIKQSFNLVE